MPVQKITGIIGVSKQASKGTISANPTFAHGLFGGTTFSVDAQQDMLDITASKRVSYNVFRKAVVNGSDFKAPGYLKSVGLWLLGALGADTVTGSGPYLHTYSTGDLPYLSVFTKGLDTTFEGVRDCKVDQFGLSWKGSDPLEASGKLLGTVMSYPSTFTITTDETGSDSFLVPVGGTFQYDLDGSTLASARVVAGDLTVNNNVASIEPSAAVEADDVYEARQDHGVKLTIVPDTLADFRNAVTGTPAGTAAALVPTVGSFSLVFKENNGGPGTLTVTAAKCAFTCVFPDADPKGGAIEVELVGIPVMPVGGTAPIVYALSNTQATYWANERAADEEGHRPVHRPGDARGDHDRRQGRRASHEAVGRRQDLGRRGPQESAPGLRGVQAHRAHEPLLRAMAERRLRGGAAHVPQGRRRRRGSGRDHARAGGVPARPHPRARRRPGGISSAAFLIADVALAAGFGLDLESCNPEIFEALIVRIAEREKQRKVEEAKAELEARVRGR